MVGSQHRCTKTYSNGRQLEDAFFDVRTVLDANEIGPSKQSLKKQGRIAAAVVADWFEGEGGVPDKELVDRIPRLERREDIYPLRQIDRRKPDEIPRFDTDNYQHARDGGAGPRAGLLFLRTQHLVLLPMIDMPDQPPITDQITQTDDGGYQIGWDDDAPAFPSRAFAEAVAIKAALKLAQARGGLEPVYRRLRAQPDNRLAAEDIT